jgi:hypothetical protein
MQSFDGFQFHDDAVIDQQHKVHRRVFRRLSHKAVTRLAVFASLPRPNIEQTARLFTVTTALNMRSDE